MRIGVIPNLRKPELEVSLKSLLEWSVRDESVLLISEKVPERVPEYDRADNVEIVPEPDMADSAEMLLAMGGDGTILAAMRHARKADLPVLGVNLGSLGFLADVGPDQLVPALEQVAAGTHEIELRMTLQADITDGDRSLSLLASNDVVVDKGEYSRVIDIDAVVGQDYVQRYTGDGIILSTPIGSTAYALAAGGPIVSPGMEALLAVPICPHTLAARPIVLSGDSVIRLTVLSKHGTALITVDGQDRVTVSSGAVVEVRKGTHRNRLVRTRLGHPFYEVLRQKLKLGFREPAERS